jgi:CheY-like chemotaxis protein
VRVPLNTARLSLANLEAEGAFANAKPDQRELLEGLDSSLRMMETVLNDMLSFSRMESGNLVLCAKAFDFHQALQHVALAYRSTESVAFHLELDPRIEALGSIVVGDAMRLRQMCSNLVSNAFKFTQEGSVRLVSRLLYPARAGAKHKSGSTPEKIHECVSFSEPGTQLQTSKAIIRVEVHDTGVGLSRTDVGNDLFSPYVQTEIGRRQGGKGTGLGLALVTQLVKLHQGRLGVSSEPGRGSMFWFELPYHLPRRAALSAPGDCLSSPASRPQSPQRPIHVVQKIIAPPVPLDSDRPASLGAHHQRHSHKLPTPPAESPPTEVAPKDPRQADPPSPAELLQLRTLVVDDDPLTRRLMSRMLRRLGHAVEEAEDGQVALGILERSWRGGPPIDVVFLDK